MSAWQLFADVARALFVFAIPLATAPLLVWLERKLAARMQGRLGPNRVGPFGLLQPLADVIKLLFKEEVTPAQVDRPLFNLAPFLAVAAPLFLFGVLPVAQDWALTDRVRITFPAVDPAEMSVVVALALISLGVYSVAFGGWASANKYSLLGGVRAAAQMISYELVLTLSILSVVLATETLSLRRIVLHQAEHGWLILTQPVGAVLFFITALAENKRAPFDLPEAEPELVGGYHTEYSSMRFGMFFMGEYIAVLAMQGLFVTMFLGGWHVPGLPQDGSLWSALLSFGAFGAKLAAMVVVVMWIRWTLPRFRWDQLMSLSWKRLLPLAMVHAVYVAAMGVRG